jgi:hypothetical protein
MADKFLSLRSGKQRVFALEVERFRTKLGERPVAVTAERDRLAVFCGKADGTWATFVRRHLELNRTPRRPDRSHRYGWSRRVGVASGDDRIVLVYRRRFILGNPPANTNVGELWIDVLAFDVDTETLGGLAEPVPVPRSSLDISGFGVCLWADRVDDQLAIVTQAFFTGHDPGPALVLLTVPFPLDDGSGLATAEWKLTTLDTGGWDFDARREGQRLFVVHRRTAATYTTDINLPPDPFFGIPPIQLSDEPESPRPLDQMAASGLVLLEVSLPDGGVLAVDDTLPFGELPQLHRIDPVVITMERLRSAQVQSRLGFPAFTQASVVLPRWRTFLVMTTQRGWRAAPLLGEARDWPCHLTDVAEAHLLIALNVVSAERPMIRLELGSLFPNNPVSLFKFEVVDKGTLLTFAHRDPVFASLRATTFRVFPDDSGNTLVAQAEGYSILDIGHRRVEPPREGATPVEYDRFEPFTLSRTREHEDGYSVTRRELETTNTLAWGLVGAEDNPQTFYAYSDMGDAGARVVYDQNLELLPPKGTVDDKSFSIDTVPEPGQSGSAWVRLQTPSFVDTRLGGYLFSPRPPRSLAADVQRALDALPLAALFTVQAPETQVENQLVGGGHLTLRDADHPGNPAFVESVLLFRGTADAIEEFAVDAGERDPVTSESDQPFPISFLIFPSVLYASRPIVFQASVPGFAADELTFEWEFSDGTTDTGRSVEHTFAATLPDQSTANPAAEPADPVEVTLTVTAPDGRTSTATTSFDLPASLWATLWEAFAPFRRRPDDEIEPGEDLFAALSPGFFATTVTVDLLKYRLEFKTSNEGEGLSLRVTFRDTHRGRFKFVDPDTPGQGDTLYEMPIAVSLSGVHLTGNTGSLLSGIVRVDSVKATMLYSKRFQACVQTSERRTEDPTSDTVVERFGDEPRMVPSALCCVPVGDTSLTLEPGSLDVVCVITDEARNLTILVAALLAAGFAAVLATVLLPLLIILLPAAAVTAVISGGISAIVSALVAGGIAFVGVLFLDLFVVRPFVTSQIRDGLTAPEVKEDFDGSGLMTYAGEGLAESLATHLICQAKRDGHSVADPENSGRNRFRPSLFEIVAVESGRCKAKMKLSG